MGEPGPSGPEVPDEARRRSVRSWLIGPTLAGLAALAGVITLLFEVGVQVWPSASESCATEGATLANITVEPRVSFREYLERTNASSEGYDAGQLEMRVNLISYDLQVDGFKNEHLTSKWSVYDATTNSGVADESLRNRLALDVEPTACKTSLHPAIWTPLVERKRDFYFKLFLYDQKGTLLAEGRSAPLRGQS